MQQVDGKFVIADERCNLCGDCLACCPWQAISARFDLESLGLQERLVDACAAVLSTKGGQAFFLSFLLDITPVCDCRSWSPTPIIGDIGMLAGKDPLAVEQTSIDLVEKAIKGFYPEKRLADFTGADGMHQLACAEKAGLGSRRYVLTYVS